MDNGLLWGFVLTGALTLTALASFVLLYHALCLF